MVAPWRRYGWAGRIGKTTGYVLSLPDSIPVLVRLQGPPFSAKNSRHVLLRSWSTASSRITPLTSTRSILMTRTKWRWQRRPLQLKPSMFSGTSPARQMSGWSLSPLPTGGCFQRSLLANHSMLWVQCRLCSDLGKKQSHRTRSSRRVLTLGVRSGWWKRKTDSRERLREFAKLSASLVDSGRAEWAQSTGHSWHSSTVSKQDPHPTLKGVHLVITPKDSSLTTGLCPIDTCVWNHCVWTFTEAGHGL